MAATIGKLLVGGSAVYFTYRFSNSTIETFSERNRYSLKSINQRKLQKPHCTEMTRNAMIERASKEQFDVIIVGGSLKSSELALDCIKSGMSTLLLARKDFSTDIDEFFLSEDDLGSYASVEKMLKTENYDFKKAPLGLVSHNQDFSLLNSAPYLSKSKRTLICYEDMLLLVKGFVKQKISDLIVNIPPRYSSRLNSNLPSWCAPELFAGAVEVHNVAIDRQRLNLVTILTAASHGAVTINHFDLIQTEAEDDSLTASIKDNLTGNIIKVSTKYIIVEKTSEKDQTTGNVIHCFEVPDILLDSDGVSFPSHHITVSQYLNPNSVVSCDSFSKNYRESFEKLKGLVKRHHLLRKGNVSTMNQILKIDEDHHWEVVSKEGKTFSEDYSINPLTKKFMSRDTLLSGSHGWHPELSREISAKYGLPISICNHLVQKYGDDAFKLAANLTKCQSQDKNEALLEIETIQACEEFAMTVEDVSKRLNVKESRDIEVIANVMGKYFNWSKSEIQKHMNLSKSVLLATKPTEEWKNERGTTTEEQKMHEKSLYFHKLFFISNAKNGLILQWQVEDHLKSLDCPLRSAIDDDIMNKSLRLIDANENGVFTEAEFMELMQRLHVTTPKEVIEAHIDILSKENK